MTPNPNPNPSPNPSPSPSPSPNQGEALRGKVVLEFPTIHVATQAEAARFALLEEDATPRAEAEAAASHQ